ncbi:E3 ubiquitin-protein ligase RING1 [Lactuca sativa]|uniref:RING-type E3 ubiquitin transferase n=1 Tax=Lactuca sativa TaxID=4236 RepID=A0A9R1WAY7_LACSA|nr:E3 ubiquitin-protein ligase RING1 [Lactuca sativa]KAJ0223282.1 hypothetical protein LSAT_V11C200074550 [Lactuca sativa]
MANRPRKFIDSCDDHSCHAHPPPPPPLPPPPTSLDQPFSPYLIFMFCGLSVSLSFICYLLFAARYGSRQRNNENTDETHEDFVNEDLGPVVHHPIWLINTIGLEQSQIESIQIFKYKRDQGLIEGTDCSVCLSEFEDDESLRLLPKCSHAFHVPCIDTWLRSHKTCPLCRAPIIKNTSEPTETVIDSSSSEPITMEETSPGEDSETVDHHVIEVENDGEVEKTCRILDETSSGVRAISDLAEHHRVQRDGSVAMRRSVSMDESSASIVQLAVANVPPPDQERPLMTSQFAMSKKLKGLPKSGNKLKGTSSSSFRIYNKAMKSSSFGHSSQKTTSFTNKCPHNRSY